MTPDDFFAAANVSRETFERLLAMDRVLMKWSAHTNLIARSSIKARWERHFFDCAQILPLLPKSFRTLADLGSGAGFPGLVIAAVHDARGVKMRLIEARRKKAAFLNEAIEAMGLERTQVIPERIEAVKPACAPDIVTARALAPLAKLLGYVHGIAGKNTRAFLHKGQDVEDELTQAAKYWHMDVIRHQSRSSSDGVILEIGNLARVKSR